jgi:hypothetical protein
MSRCSVGLRTERPGSIPGRCKIFVFSTAFRPALGPTQTTIQWVLGALSTGVKRPAREANHSPPSNAVVKNGGAVPPLLRMCFWHSAYLIKHSDNFIFYYEN